MKLQPTLMDQSGGTKLDPDLMYCDKEAIHTPGLIQPHGALLAVRAEDLLITHASENLATVVGISAEAVLGRSLRDIVGEVVCHALSETFPVNGSGARHLECQTTLTGAVFNLRSYDAGALIGIDIEQKPADSRTLPVVMIQSLLARFQRATSRSELCELAVRGLKELTGYDRVMAYRFHDEGDGEVIAEACNADLEPYLGLRYPASDVPRQARRQYLAQRVGAVSDSHYVPVPILTHPTLHDGTPLDLTLCSLRSISPLHLEYMRNMNTGASLTVGLAHQHDLWGMLVCHHGTPRIAGVEIRAAAGMIGQVISLLLSSLSHAEAYARQIGRAENLRCLVERLTAPIPLAEALAAAEPELLELAQAEGALVRFSGKLFCLGRTPPEFAACHAMSVLHEAAGGKPLAVDDLAKRHPELAACAADGSGALLLPLSRSTDDAILWFRPEMSGDVVWGGRPDKGVDADTGRVSPRKSFSAWREKVRGRSTPWQDADLTLASELRAAIKAEVGQRSKAELAVLRQYDYLTSLPNRRLFHDHLEQALAAARSSGSIIAVFYLDLDHFKQINDLLGHPAGDQTLRIVAERLTGCVRSSDTLARLGGDEFAIILPTLPRREDADILAQRLIDAVKPPIEVGGQFHHVGLSVGIAVSDAGAACEPEDLMKQADMALYRAKAEGRGQARCFTLDMDRQLHERRAMEIDLRRALEEDGLTLQYQPQVDLASERILSAEALLRWHRPGYGMVPPAQFLELAENAGLIVRIGTWALGEACRQAVHWPDRIGIAVNVSPKQLRQSDFCQVVAKILQETGLVPSRLELEITESALMHDTEHNIVMLQHVDKLGVKLTLDDFGTGYSSLAYLLKFRFDKVKIDFSFIERLGQASHAKAIVSAVVVMAHALGALSVAEGVETRAEAEVLRALGCSHAQGLLFGPSVSAEGFASQVQLDATAMEDVTAPGLS